MQISVSIKRGQDILLTTFEILNKKDTTGYSSNLLMNTRRNKQAEQTPGQNSIIWVTFFGYFQTSDLDNFRLHFASQLLRILVEISLRSIYKLAYEVGCPVFGRCGCKSHVKFFSVYGEVQLFNRKWFMQFCLKLYFPFRVTFGANIELPCFRPTDPNSGQFSFLVARRESICPQPVE